MTKKLPKVLQPDLHLLVKIGSIVVHADEAISTTGHQFDVVAMQSLLNDPSVRDWIRDMGVYLPVKR